MNIAGSFHRLLTESLPSTDGFATSIYIFCVFLLLDLNLLSSHLFVVYFMME